MQVILLEKIRHLGSLGDQVKVKSGFGRNFLIPQGKAVFATPDNIVKFEKQRAELEKIAAGHLKVAQDRMKTLEALGPITIAMRASEEGKLFGSIGTRDLAEIITKAGVAVEKSEIHMPQGALRHVGEYEIAIEFHSDVNTMVKVIIAPEA